MHTKDKQAKEGNQRIAKSKVPIKNRIKEAKGEQKETQERTDLQAFARKEGKQKKFKPSVY